jgi:hypothetical protein
MNSLPALLLTNAIILTLDEKMTLYEPGALAIQGDHIAALGPEAALLEQYPAAERLDCGGKVLMPGLINAHTHVPMTLLRGLADDLRLDVWLMGYMMPVEREFVSPDFVRLGTRLACAELIRSGVTCFADMYYFEDDVAAATAEAGLRAVCGQTVLKFPAPDARDYEEALDLARNFIQRWKDHPLIVPSVPRMPPIPAPKRSCARPPRWRSSSTCRCKSTFLKPPWKWKIRATSTACQSSLTPRNSTFSTPRCWPRTVSMWTKARSKPSSTTARAWRTTPPPISSWLRVLPRSAPCWPPA